MVHIQAAGGPSAFDYVPNWAPGLGLWLRPGYSCVSHIQAADGPSPFDHVPTRHAGVVYLVACWFQSRARRRAAIEWEGRMIRAEQGKRSITFHGQGALQGKSW